MSRVARRAPCRSHLLQLRGLPAGSSSRAARAVQAARPCGRRPLPSVVCKGEGERVASTGPAWVHSTAETTGTSKILRAGVVAPLTWRVSARRRANRWSQGSHPASLLHQQSGGTGGTGQLGLHIASARHGCWRLSSSTSDMTRGVRGAATARPVAGVCAREGAIRACTLATGSATKSAAGDTWVCSALQNSCTPVRLQLSLVDSVACAELAYSMRNLISHGIRMRSWMWRGALCGAGWMARVANLVATSPTPYGWRPPTAGDPIGRTAQKSHD